jgi:hypothetical protein
MEMINLPKLCGYNASGTKILFSSNIFAFFPSVLQFFSHSFLPFKTDWILLKINNFPSLALWHQPAIPALGRYW